MDIEIEKELGEMKEKKHRTVFVSGNFNVVHPGHLRLLNFAKSCGDHLVVGVHDDGSPGALVPQELRLEGVKSVGFVDEAFMLSEAPEEYIRKRRPDIVVKGKEHEEQENPEKMVVDEYNGKLLFSSGDVRFSSLDLLKAEMAPGGLLGLTKPQGFMERHDISDAKLQSLIDKFKELRVTVVGDIIVDEYVTCDPLGMSQEDPTLVVSPVYRNKFIGGAAIVAAHARGLGAQVNFFGVTGEDELRDYCFDKLKEFGVNAHLECESSRPTSLKQRFRANGKTLLRVNHLRQHDINKSVAETLYSQIESVIDSTDLFIFSDFNYGCLPQSLVDKLGVLCNNKEVTIVADSQSSSQIGDVSRFKGASLLTPTEREARLATQDFSSGLVTLSEKLRSKAEAKAVALTLGAEGVLIRPEEKDGKEWGTDRIPALNGNCKDPAGAGDSFLTTMSLAMAAGANAWEAGYLGSLAAATQVSRLGNLPLSIQDLSWELDG